ncbi:hypothetical protein GSI01S_39_00560 [Gordonia sihwensis NBRC 108236]|uniref:Uncharacterized protein n=1 Tax=Gordonia sihwensis NBRC 108236 TaxID=1223544 RepID=L7LRH0_9ACTN|nr:hypothetical protein GSI01S_39_00560 [Gordonia sihwensis NBRC 108236]
MTDHDPECVDRSDTDECVGTPTQGNGTVRCTRHSLRQALQPQADAAPPRRKHIALWSFVGVAVIAAIALTTGAVALVKQEPRPVNATAPSVTISRPVFQPIAPPVSSDADGDAGK